MSVSSSSKCMQRFALAQNFPSAVRDQPVGDKSEPKSAARERTIAGRG
ncbi:hypothetical protein [Nisaea sp.]